MVHNTQQLGISKSFLLFTYTYIRRSVSTELCRIVKCNTSNDLLEHSYNILFSDVLIVGWLYDATLPCFHSFFYFCLKKMFCHSWFVWNWKIVLSLFCIPSCENLFMLLVMNGSHGFRSSSFGFCVNILLCYDFLQGMLLIFICL